MVILFVKYDSFSRDLRFSSQAGKNHANIVNHLTRTVVVAARGRAIVRLQGPLRMGAHSEPEPDLTLLQPRADYYREFASAAADVLLIIEVSDSTQRYDRRVKVPLYARHGVPEVWVIDLESRLVHFYRRPSGDGYADIAASDRPGVTPVSALSGAWRSICSGYSERAAGFAAQGRNQRIGKIQVDEVGKVQ